MTANSKPLAVRSWDEWSPLKSIIVGTAANSCFPFEHERMISSTTTAAHAAQFKKDNPFPQYILKAADKELDKFAKVLRDRGIEVFRPNTVDWRAVGGYTGSMVRDGLLVVGSTIIESAYSWRSREKEVDLMLKDTLFKLAEDPRITIVRAPKPPARETLYDGYPEANKVNPLNGVRWAINNSRIAFDAADFMRFGNVVVGQYSHVTNDKGIDYVRSHLPKGVLLELLDVDDPHCMHLDAVLLPLRKGLLIYNPDRTNKEALSKIKLFDNWDCKPFPFVPKARSDPPSYMTSNWLVLNLLVLDPHTIMVDEYDPEFAEFLRKECGMEVIGIPFRHVNCLGGSLHCATLDLVRDS
ncbi:Amidinotransferase family protein [Penicillium atrosanguineum]|nr:Amidinotransferase family protein [Penicillium atrosanguineum]